MANSVSTRDIEDLEDRIRQKEKYRQMMIVRGYPSQALEDALSALYKTLQRMKDDQQRRQWTEDHG